jgi:hypothetical protein
MPAADELPSSLQVLARRQAVALSPASLDIRRLVSVLESALSQEETPQRQEGTQRRNPRNRLGCANSRLLTSAVRVASALAGEEKAAAMAAVNRAAANCS